MNLRFLSPVTALAWASLVPPALAQHAHLNAGAQSTDQQAQLIWANGMDFIASSGYVKTLQFTNAGRFAGYHEGGITLTALPATAAHAGPDPDAAAPGSFLQFRMACLAGPPGGEFGFWDAGTTQPSLQLQPGQASTQLWKLSEGDGTPGSDPYGHVHGRRFTATKPGIYLIGFTAVDTSTNGLGGGPIHTPSDELRVWFQAGVNIQHVEPDFAEGHVHVTFGAAAGFTWQLQTSTNLGPAALWQPAGRSVTGADLWVEILHDAPPGPQRFYRVLGSPIEP